MVLTFPPSFGARAHDIAEGVSPEELARQSAEVGMYRLQLALMKSYPQVAGTTQLNQGLGEQFRSAFAKHGVSVAIFSCYQNLIHPDAEARRAVIDRFKAYIKHAPSFGARLVVSETGSTIPGLGYTPDNFKKPAYQAVVDTVVELCDEAGRHGVLVGIEPGLNHPIYSIETTKQLINDVNSPNLGIVLDPFNLLHAISAGGTVATDPSTYLEQLDRAFGEFGDVIEAVQLKDFVDDDAHTQPNGVQTVPVGTGNLLGVQAVEFINNAKPGLDIIFEGTPKAQIPAAFGSLGH